MALKKNKSDILNKIIFKQELEYDQSLGYDDYDDDYCDWDWDDDDWRYIEYDYLPTVGPYSWVRRIDMRSVNWSTEILRERKLNYLLGITDVYETYTFGDLLKEKENVIN